ncbi:MAG: transposase [Candidatus Saccharimonadales bacterium]
MAQYISNDKKQEIVSKVRDGGAAVSSLAVEYGVSTKSIYTWLRDGIKGDNSVLQINRLKRENEMLYGLLGKLTAETSRSKK